MRALVLAIAAGGISVGCGNSISAVWTGPQPDSSDGNQFEEISRRFAGLHDVTTTYPQMIAWPSDAQDKMNRLVEAVFLERYIASRNYGAEWNAEFEAGIEKWAAREAANTKAGKEPLSSEEWGEKDEWFAIHRGSSEEVSYSCSHLSPATVSLCGRLYAYSGGAHGNLIFFPVNYWWHEGRAEEIHLTDLFDPAHDWRVRLEPIVRLALAEAKKAKGYNGDRSVEWYLERNRVGLERLTNETLLGAPFTFSERGIEFHYAPYAVDCFAAGDFHVLVPIERIDNILSADGPMASWLR